MDKLRKWFRKSIPTYRTDGSRPEPAAERTVGRMARQYSARGARAILANRSLSHSPLTQSDCCQRNCFPPELCWRGTSLHHADDSRALKNCVTSTSQIKAIAIGGPTPGIVNRRRYAIFCYESAAISLSRVIIRSFITCIFSRSEDSSRRRVNVMQFEASSISSGSYCWRCSFQTGIVKAENEAGWPAWFSAQPSVVVCSEEL